MTYAGRMPQMVRPPRRKVSAHRVRALLMDLASDWLLLSTTLPKPPVMRSGRRTSSRHREFGHPAEWASDTAASIVHVLWMWHDYAAEMRGETRPAPMVSVGGRRQRRDRDVLTAAVRFLEPRIEDLVESGRWLEFSELPVPWARRWEWQVDDAAFDELFDIHRRVQFGTGQAKPRKILPMPCPSSDCGLRTLERHQGMAGREFIVCAACGHAFDEAAYPFLLRVLIDTLNQDPAG